MTYVAQQLSIPDVACVAQYRTRDTHWDHVAEIQQTYGYRDFPDPREVFRLVRWLYTRAWLSAERPSVLFDLATARLVERKVLLPGVTALERLVARVRDRSPPVMASACQTADRRATGQARSACAGAGRRTVKSLGSAAPRSDAREWAGLSGRFTTP